MFNLYSGNRLEDLATILARILNLSTPGNPFEQESILVQSPGMAQWLKMYLADQQGIAAGYDFPLPSTFVWRCFQQSLDDIPEHSEFNKPFLVWRIMRLLDQRLATEEFQQLAWYLADDDTLLRRFQLCSSIADVYDQYLMYRPDWIAAWEAGDFQLTSLTPALSKQETAKFAEQAWQPILWRDLVADVSLHQQSLYHRANLIEGLHDVTRSRSRPSDMPERIFIFGVSALPPNTLQALRLLSESGWLEVHLFLHNPCRYYWGDIVDKKYLGRALKRNNIKPNLNPDTLHLDANPLLASWGRLGRDYIGELQEFANDNLEVFENYHEEDHGPHDDKALVADSSISLYSTSFYSVQQPKLLHYLQQDILDMENHGAAEERTLDQQNSRHKHLVSDDDRSVSLQICHSALREVEVLHNNLLAMFDEDPELTPKDIIVMLPDVNLYSPFIQAVFGQASDSQRIPYSLIDQSANLENAVIDAYIGLLSLTDSRFTLSELISILEVPAVLATFDMNVTEMEQIRQWCQESGIRWGLDQQTAEALSLPKQEYNTWHNGLSRMLLGYAMGHDEIWQGLLSYGEVEGLNAELAGKLAEFLEAIRITEIELSQTKKPAEWGECLHALSKRFFTLEEKDPFPSLLTNHISAMMTEWQHACFDDELDSAIIRAILSPRLQETQGSKRFLAGRVNFCTLMPMRSVPFKVICLLGLNEGAYPRSVVPMGFDLMVGNYRSGDRSRREDDKYLFLEAVMSAREHLYISYVGRMVKDNSELNPSILVSELLDYIGQSCALAEHVDLLPEESQKRLLSHIKTEHRLQPFHESYYENLSSLEGEPSSDRYQKYFSYDASWLPAVQGKKQTYSAVSVTDISAEQEPSALSQSSELSEPSALQKPSALPELFAQTMELELGQLIRFYQHPTRYFMQHRLKAFLQLNEVEESEDEPFQFDGLTRYQLRESLLSALQANQLDGMLENLKLSGKYPYGAFGDMEVEPLVKQAQVMMAGLDEYHHLNLEPVNIDLLIPLQELQKQNGSIDAVSEKESREQESKACSTNDRLVAWLPLSNHNLALTYHMGELSAGKKISTWLSHLAYAAQGLTVESRIISFKKSNTLDLITHVFAAIPQEKALKLLSVYMALFRLGDRLALPLPSKAADIWCQHYLSAKYQEETEEQKRDIAWQRALASYHDDFNDFAEGKNAYWQRFFPNLAEHKERFIDYVILVWLPLYEHIHVADDEADFHTMLGPC